MARQKQLTSREAAVELIDIVFANCTGTWELSLPPSLRMYQGELEALLGKVFSSRQMQPENLALAQQMSLNWCVSKCREVGISFEESFVNANN